MKRVLVIATWLVLIVLVLRFDAATPPPDQAALKEHLVNLEKQSWEAWKKRDGKFFEQFLSEDHVEVGFGGIATKAEVVAFVGSPVCEVKSYELDQFELRLLDNSMALLTYRASQDTVCYNPVPSPCWVSSLYMKRGARWRNVLYQQTQISPPASPSRTAH